MSVRILIGDVREKLAELPDESVHCVVTSPPYWGLRDYGVDGQIGLEPSVAEWTRVMVEVFAEVRRVLRSDGTAWINIGDSYVSGQGGRQSAIGELPKSLRRDRPTPHARQDVDVAAWGQRALTPRNYPGRDSGLKAKDQMLQPERLALALQDDGWWVRRRIIWAKPNPAPETVRDRPTNSHEIVYLLSRSARYFYDAAAAREPTTGGAHARKSIKTPDGWDTSAGDGGHGSFHREGREKGKYRPAGVGPKSARPGEGIKANESYNAALTDMVDDRNMRDVWTIPIQAFAGAHFATFPDELARRCIVAGCPKDGTVLDPFGGAGTTGLVADRLGRNAVLIELNPQYAEIARKRIHGDAPMFADVVAA